MSQATTPRYSETSSLWIAALILPLVVLLSGVLIAFLCWRRLRSSNSSLKRSKQLSTSPASSQDTCNTSPSSSKSNSVLQYPRPLFLCPHSSPTLAHRLQQSTPSHTPTTLLFPSVSTTVNSQGSRVIVRRGRKSWPPEIGWPIPLEPIYPITNDPVTQGGGREERNEIETDLHRGISQVTGYHSNSHAQDLNVFHHSLVEEASNTRNSWNEGDDASIHFSTLPNYQRPPPPPRPLRTRSLSSRSFSEYSHLTIGATTLGRLLDEEIDRVARQQREQERAFDRSSTPLVPFIATDTVQPLALPRHEHPQSSADLYSLHPISSEQHFIPFPRLPPISHSQDLPSTPSPLPQEDVLPFDSPHNTSTSPPLESNQNRVKGTRERKESKNWDGKDLVEWRNGKMEERKKEREEVMRRYNED